MNKRRESWLKRLPALFEIPAPDAERARRRIELMERNVMLPAKCFFIGTIFYSFYRNSLWVGNISSTQDVVVETMQIIFWFYVPLCALLALPILVSRRLPLAVLQWTVVTSSLVDGLLVACMSVITGGMDSILYWLFVGLILRNAASIPPGFSQLFLNFAISMCYVLVAMLNSTIIANLDDATIKAMDLSPNEGLGESFLLRLLVLWLTTISCHGAQAFVEKQHVVAAEAEEFAVRENQLRAAGRLAAEFAHQIKNPLAIISNSAHSLQRSARENKPASLSQIEIIQEEVARADRVITQIMGYAQLSEGRVEKLNVVEELDRAISQVLPAAMPTEIVLEKRLAAHFPPLLMQRGHFSEIVVNLLQNAREALDGRGKIILTADCLRDHSVVVTVADNGPGVPPDRVERIFEAYFTTKEKGTGLGLAIVKHNAELYGGTVRLESELGKGAKFMVTFPAKTVPKPFVT